MARMRYHYNPETCQYEPIIHTGRHFLNQTGRFILICLILAFGGLAYYLTHYPSLDENQLTRENHELKWQWGELQNEIRHVSNQLRVLEHDDDDHYRVLLAMNPLDPSMRLAGAGGHAPVLLPAEESVSEILGAYDSLFRLGNRIEVHEQSLKELEAEVAVKERQLSTRPAMQPIDNRQLTRFNSIFGMRLHPVYRDWRNHNGLDLTAPQGTPVYATGDGIVSLAAYNGGYGNVVYINHGFGFESRYGHLSKFNTQAGQQVKRGDLIGFVGSTGVSTTPHLHYEVLYHGKYVNPINFMYRDVKQEEYNKLIRKAPTEFPDNKSSGVERR